MDAKTPNTLQQRIVSEVKELLTIFVYLALFFCAFMAYRHLVMRQLGISYFQYGFALLKAFVLAKVILLGQRTRLSKWLDHRPLIIPTLYKTLIFSLFALLFEILETAVGAAIHGRPMTGALEEIMSVGRDEMLSRTLVMLVAFLPLFAFREIGRVLGEGRLNALFFKRRPTPLQMHLPLV